MTRWTNTDLSEPPALAADTMRVIPLGGLGEVGRNMTVFEINGQLLVVDCGVLFPEETQPGVDLILPDINNIKDRLDDIVAVVLTHGHEDHIGAVPYLLKRRPDIPIVGSQLTLALIEAKLKEHRIKPFTLAVREGQVEKLGEFECEFVAVNHSIPDALAVFLRTKAGTLWHTGDFKMDPLVSLYYFAPACAVTNGLFTALVELPRLTMDDIYRLGPMVLFANAFVAFLLNVSGVLLVSFLCHFFGPHD